MAHGRAGKRSAAAGGVDGADLPPDAGNMCSSAAGTVACFTGPACDRKKGCTSASPASRPLLNGSVWALTLHAGGQRKKGQQQREQHASLWLHVGLPHVSFDSSNSGSPEVPALEPVAKALQLALAPKLTAIATASAWHPFTILPARVVGGSGLRNNSSSCKTSQQA